MAWWYILRDSLRAWPWKIGHASRAHRQMTRSKPPRNKRKGEWEVWVEKSLADLRCSWNGWDWKMKREGKSFEIWSWLCAVVHEPHGAFNFSGSFGVGVHEFTKLGTRLDLEKDFTATLINDLDLSGQPKTRKARKGSHSKSIKGAIVKRERSEEDLRWCAPEPASVQCLTWWWWKGVRMEGLDEELKRKSWEKSLGEGKDTRSTSTFGLGAWFISWHLDEPWGPVSLYKYI